MFRGPVSQGQVLKVRDARCGVQTPCSSVRSCGPPHRGRGGAGGCGALCQIVSRLFLPAWMWTISRLGMLGVAQPAFRYFPEKAAPCVAVDVVCLWEEVPSGSSSAAYSQIILFAICFPRLTWQLCDVWVIFILFTMAHKLTQSLAQNRCVICLLL